MTPELLSDEALDEIRVAYRSHADIQMLLGHIDALTTERDALAASGAELYHWLQIWIANHPGTTWCYSEGALSAWRALISRPFAVREG